MLGIRHLNAVNIDLWCGAADQFHADAHLSCETLLDALASSSLRHLACTDLATLPDEEVVAFLSEVHAKILNLEKQKELQRLTFMVPDLESYHRLVPILTQRFTEERGWAIEKANA